MNFEWRHYGQRKQKTIRLPINMMHTAPPQTPSHPDSPPSRRWLLVLTLSVILHLFALQWARLPTNTPHKQPAYIVTTELRTAAAPELPPELPDPVRQTPARAPATSIPVLQTKQSTASISVPSSNRQTSRYHINLPPSAQLVYDVTATRKGVSSAGRSSLQWQSDGMQYRITGTTEIDASTTRSFQSEGTIDQYGIAPLLYTEKSRNRSTTNTHFQREHNLISFSSSTINYPRQGGEQDRASIIWQLASIGRGAPGKFLPGAGFDMFVAGTRDGGIWHIEVVGEEEIHSPSGLIKGWHLVRRPQYGTYEQRLDIWLSPQHDWYPVKLRYTQANGDTLEMSLHTTHPVPAANHD